MLEFRTPFLEVDSSISTARLVSIFTSSKLGPISAFPGVHRPVFIRVRTAYSIAAT